jgi:hypothetical protein
MEAFSPNPPDWREIATHAEGFCCPKCRASSGEATGVWIDRRSPVYTDNRQRKWQEFYLCQCGAAWWAWSTDRAPNEFADRTPYNNNEDSDLDYDSFFGYF